MQQPSDILPVLYDLSLTIGSEIRLHPLLQRTLQRLLYHTSFSAGFVCLDVGDCAGAEETLPVIIEAAVGDFDLVSMCGHPVPMPCGLLCGTGERNFDGGELAEPLEGVRSPYRAFLRLPLEGRGVVVLLAQEKPDTKLALTQILKPVLSQLSRAIVLCRSNEAQIAAAEEARQTMERSLGRLEGQYRAIVELSPIGVGLSSDGVIREVNKEWLKMFGYQDESEIRDRPLLDCIAPPARPDVVDSRAQGQPVEQVYETLALRKDGASFPMLVSAKRVETPEGARTFTFFIDLSEQKKNERALHTAHETLRTVLETAPIRIFWKDLELRYQGCNAAFAHDAGLAKPEDVVGRDDFDMVWHEQAELYREDDRKVMASGKAKLDFEEPQTAPDGRTIWLRTSKIPLRDAQGQVIGVMGVYDDITERKEAEAQIHQLAFFDTLTGLPNRRLMQDRLQQALAASTRNRQYGALCMLDLDDFKVVNDTRGHATGDQLLQEVSRRLVSSVRDGDTIARLGGDEFVVILEGLSGKPADAAEQAERVAEKLRASLLQPIELEGYSARVSCSIGIVTFLDHERAIDDLLKFADTAMYQAKAAGRNTIRFYDPLLQAELESRLKLGEELLQAIGNEELELHLQRQVDGTGRVIGAEALLRWRHPVQGMVSPGRFIPLAEDSGLIVPIGAWVLDRACALLRSWQDGPATRELVLAVNVSARQFRQPDFVTTVQQSVMRHGIKPFRLKIELTESIVLENVEDTINKMRDLKLMGVSFSLDDFGTGYSSLQYLKRLPLDQIKIDQSFVRDIASDPNDAAIVQTIIAMADVLGLDVIAEGVETEAQREFLDLRGCHHFQGYLFGRPVPVAEFEASLGA